ncbi:DUF1961 family protein [Radiobacillus sp. PE A8.2]|uniref:DUF1961 family protein n=1 Tax=Radiobacillus sp. PE A8.2 TaxID=3380349 RepID=UPI003890A271
MEYKKELLYKNSFTCDTGDFVLEGEGKYKISNGKLFLNDIEGKGLTVWLNKTFHGNIYITYVTEALEPEFANNLNLFFMAKTLNDKNILSEKHSGNYAAYHQNCNTYIFTFTGDVPGIKKAIGWSRLRKDPGFVILSEEASLKAKVSKKYVIEISVCNGEIECKINGQTVHKYTDSKPYTSGSIGFRTWKTHLSVKNFSVYALI